MRGWAYLDNVDLTGRSRELTLTLRSGEVAVDVPADDHPDLEADTASDLWWADVTGSGFSAVVDTTALRGGTGVWHLDATVSVAGLSATGRATVRPWTMAGVPAWADPGGRHWHLDHDDAQQAELRVRRTPWREVGLAVDGDLLRVGFASAVRSVSLEAPGRSPVPASLDGLTASLPIGALDAPHWALRAVAADGSSHDVIWPAAGVDDVRVRPSRRGTVTVSPSAAEVVSVTPVGESVVVRLRASRPRDAEVALLVGEHATPGDTRVDGDLVEATLPLSGTRWGEADLPLPSGQYAVAVRRAGGPWTIAGPSGDLCRSLPVEELHQRLRLRVEAFAPDRPGVRVVVGPPLADDELGQRQQRILRETSAGRDRRPRQRLPPRDVLRARQRQRPGAPRGAAPSRLVPRAALVGARPVGAGARPAGSGWSSAAAPGTTPWPGRASTWSTCTSSSGSSAPRGRP